MRAQEFVTERKKRRGKKSSRYGGYFFPGYAYYGSEDSGEGGGDGGGESKSHIAETSQGHLHIGDLTIDVDSHAIEQVYFREIDPGTVDRALRRLPSIQDQLMSMPAASKVWVRDPDTGLSIGLRRNNEQTAEFQFKTAVMNRTFQSVTPEIELGESAEHLQELSFLGSPCTKDCSGHRAGYEWSKRKGLRQAQSHSQSFNNGAALAVAGR